MDTSAATSTWSSA